MIVPNGGVGTHAAYWVISGQPFVLTQWIKYIYVVEMCALLAMCLTKLSILAIYIRILRDPWSLRVAYACVGITLAAWVGDWIACSLQFVPFEYQWDTPSYKGKTSFSTGLFIDGKWVDGSNSTTIEYVHNP